MNEYSQRPTDATRLLLVTGSGRSGTSTVAGTLERLGLHVPQPVVPPDETNPRGFYEPQWVVDFHKKVLGEIPVRTIDARPEAASLTAEVANDPEAVRTLTEWLRGEARHSQIVVKDPRAFWVHDLWRSVCHELSVDLGFLTMLRHPVEVAQSRDSAYLTKQTEEFRVQRETGNIAAWCNAAFETELATRPDPRAFVRYVDLMSDWRVAMSSASESLGLSYNADLATVDHHPVDDFIDVKLRRSTRSWSDVAVASGLQDLAESVWQAMSALVEDPQDAEAIATLEAKHGEYVTLHLQAEAVSMDSSNARIAVARRETRTRLAQRYEERVEKLKRRNNRLRRRIERLESQLENGRESEASENLSTRFARRVRNKLR